MLVIVPLVPGNADQHLPGFLSRAQPVKETGGLLEEQPKNWWAHEHQLGGRELAGLLPFWRDATVKAEEPAAEPQPEVKPETTIFDLY